MPDIKLQAFVPGHPDWVFQYVTAFSPTGQPDIAALQSRYGQLLSQEGNTYSFQETEGDKICWQCAFEPPRRRVMRAVDSPWADRIDEFEPSGDGTLWTILWETKTRGLKTYTQWLGFRFSGRRRTMELTVAPVIEHFQSVRHTFY